MSAAIDLSVSQFGDAWRVLCGDAPGFTTERDPELDFVFSGLPIPFFNIAVARPVGLSADALGALGARASSWARGQDAPWFFVVTHEALDAGVDAAAILDSHGFVPAIPLTGMRAEHIAPATRLPEGVDLRATDLESDCAGMVDVNTAAYGVNLDASKPLLARPSFWKRHRLVVGSKAGSTVCSAAVLDVSGHRYVALVATEPNHQRQGLAEAAMRRALDEAARAYGPRPTFLHATDAGRPIYTRMGYETLAHHTAFIEKRFAEAH